MNTPKMSAFVLVAALAGTQASAQHIPAEKVPQAARTAFATRFPSAEKVGWELEHAKTYEAEFVLGGKEMSANFDAGGKWLETEKGIQEAALPEAVRKTLIARCPGVRPSGCEEVETPEGKFYEMDMKENGQAAEVKVRADGTWVSSKVEEEKEEDDKD